MNLENAYAQIWRMTMEQNLIYRVASCEILSNFVKDTVCQGVSIISGTGNKVEKQATTWHINYGWKTENDSDSSKETNSSGI